MIVFVIKSLLYGFQGIIIFIVAVEEVYVLVFN